MDSNPDDVKIGMPLTEVLGKGDVKGIFQSREAGDMFSTLFKGMGQFFETIDQAVGNSGKTPDRTLAGMFNKMATQLFPDAGGPGVPQKTKAPAVAPSV